MTEITEKIGFLASLPPETINALAGLAAVLVAGLAVWAVHRANRGEGS